MLPCVLVFAAGCGESESLEFVPVTGKVTVNGKPLTAGIVFFVPDSSKGNTVKVNPQGRLSPEGTYELSTDQGSGAPPGSYKVTITTQSPGLDMKSSVKLDQKYASATTTPLAVEVVESPSAGAYDFAIKQ